MELTKAKIESIYSQWNNPYCELLLVSVLAKATLNRFKSLIYSCLDVYPYLYMCKYYCELLADIQQSLYFYTNSTHHAIVPLQAGTASQGASFAFKKSYNTPAMPLLSSTLSGFFRSYV